MDASFGAEQGSDTYDTCITQVSHAYHRVVACLGAEHGSDTCIGTVSMYHMRRVSDTFVSRYVSRYVSHVAWVHHLGGGARHM